MSALEVLLLCPLTCNVSNKKNFCSFVSNFLLSVVAFMMFSVSLVISFMLTMCLGIVLFHVSKTWVCFLLSFLDLWFILIIKFRKKIQPLLQLFFLSCPLFFLRLPITCLTFWNWPTAHCLLMLYSLFVSLFPVCLILDSFYWDIFKFTNNIFFYNA